MRLRPLGERFAVESPLPVQEAKQRLRSGFVGWFQPHDAPRGWILGSYLCVWNTALNSQGPMILARVREDRSGTRISGYAGFDLNGLIFPILLLVAIAVIMVASWWGGANPPFLLLLGFAAFLAFVIWTRSFFHRDADPLLRFIERRVATGATTRQFADPPLRQEWTLIVNDVVAPNVPTTERLRELLLAAEYSDGDVLILEISEQQYIQAASRDGAFLLEKRDGADDEHYRAFSSHEAGVDAMRLSAEQVFDAMASHMDGKPRNQPFVWRRVAV